MCMAFNLYRKGDSSRVRVKPHKSLRLPKGTENRERQGGLPWLVESVLHNNTRLSKSCKAWEEGITNTRKQYVVDLEKRVLVVQWCLNRFPFL